jgi:hypothetical protein
MLRVNAGPPEEGRSVPAVPMYTPGASKLEAHTRILEKKRVASRRARHSLLRTGPVYPAAFTMSKIGRYIDTTMPPTTTPRNTIIIGSIIASRPDTAASTSSS